MAVEGADDKVKNWLMLSEENKEAQRRQNKMGKEEKENR